MAFIERDLLEKLKLEAGPKARVIYGPRQSGKTTLLRQISQSLSTTWFTGDSVQDVQALDIPSTDDLKNILTQNPCLMIDEAQRVPGIGMLIKRLVDINQTLEKPTTIYATGSSSFELATGIKESALGRIRSFELWPLSVHEIAQDSSWGNIAQNIHWHMVYGLYPEIITSPEQAKDTLIAHCNSLLYKDVFALGGIRLSAKFEHLVRYLAYNMGSIISYDNVCRDIGISKNTVADYIRLLEQCFIVKVCTSYAKNLSNELKKSKKIYFYDNGIRNAIIGDFSPIATRADAGALWENFVFVERLKHHSLKRDYAQVYFWRTSERNPHEIDFIEIVDGKMKAIECKLSAKETAKPCLAFRRAYPDCPINTVAPNNLKNLWEL